MYMLLIAILFICFALSREDERYVKYLPLSVIGALLAWTLLPINWTVRLAIIFLTAGSMIDIHLRELPDSMTLSALICVGLYLLLFPSYFPPLDTIMAIIIFVITLAIYLFTDGLGYGDVKILVPILLIATLRGIVIQYLFYLWILMILSIIWLVIFRKNKEDRYIPVGQLLVGGLILAFFFSL